VAPVVDEGIDHFVVVAEKAKDREDREVPIEPTLAKILQRRPESDVPIDQVRDALGHSSIKMTDTCLRSRKGRLKEAYRKRAQHQARKRMKLVV